MAAIPVKCCSGADTDVGMQQAQVRVDPITLAYSDPALEQAFLHREEDLRLRQERTYLFCNVVIGLVHCSLSVFLTHGTLLSHKAPLLVLPYAALALLHWLLASTQLYARNRLAVAIALEAAYAAVCTLSMPHWVLLHNDTVLNWRLYLKDFVLGSGVLVSYWLLFLVEKPFKQALWVLPAECAAQVLHLSGATCRVLDATPYGRGTSTRIAAGLHRAVGALLPGYQGSSSPCMDLVMSWQILMCISLLYFKYRLELRERVAFSHGKFEPLTGWPSSPALIQALLHLAAGLQLGFCVWVLVSSQ